MKTLILFFAFIAFVHAAPATQKEWTIEMEGFKTFVQFSDFKNKLKTNLADSVSVIEKSMNRSQIVVTVKGKTNLGEIKAALIQMTQDSNNGKIEWKLKGSDDNPYFYVELK